MYLANHLHRIEENYAISPINNVYQELTLFQYNHEYELWNFTDITIKYDKLNHYNKYKKEKNFNDDYRK